ncbi:hypothetical protein Tco_0039715 [Tanacetum coccineum]
MTTLKFVDCHNMVAFLSKPTESEGFEHIVDFLNAHPIRYALMVNPTIYVSCIEQFWSTAKAKTINEERQLHALVYGKKIIIIESPVRRDLQLADEEGVDCLPNYTIHEQLALMGYENPSQKLTFYKSFFSHQWKFLIHTILQCLSPKTTAWNEFSSIMASAIICLATNQKFNFSKMIFDSMIRNLDNVFGKFLMYQRFVQTFLDNQLDKRPSHKRKYIAPCHTKKIFANVKRIGKDFSGRVTPLFQTMVVQNQKQMGEGLANLTNPQHTPTFIHTTPQPQKTQKHRKPRRKDTEVPQPSGPTESVADEAVYKEVDDSGGPRCQETMGDTIAQTRFENVSKQSYDPLLARDKVLALEKTKTTQAAEITSLKKRVESSNEEENLDKEASKQERKIDDIVDDIDVTLVNDVMNDANMFDVNDLDGEEVVAEKEVVAKKEVVAEKEVAVNEKNVEVVSTTKPKVSVADTLVSAATTTAADKEMTLAQAIIEIKSTKTKAKWIVMQEPSESTPTISLQQPSQVKSQGSKDKGKAKMIEPEKPLKNKHQIKFDEEVSLKLQAQFEEEERLARERAQQE